MKKNDIKFMNSFGVIFDNEVLIHEYNPRRPILFDELSRVNLSKVRKLHYNFLSVFSALALVGAILYLNFSFFFYALVVLFAIFGFGYKKHEYRFFLQHEQDFKEFVIKRGMKEDAKKIFLEIKKKQKQIKKRNEQMKGSQSA